MGSIYCQLKQQANKLHLLYCLVSYCHQINMDYTDILPNSPIKRFTYSSLHEAGLKDSGSFIWHAVRALDNSHLNLNNTLTLNHPNSNSWNNRQKGLQSALQMSLTATHAHVTTWISNTHCLIMKLSQVHDVWAFFLTQNIHLTQVQIVVFD